MLKMDKNIEEKLDKFYAAEESYNGNRWIVKYVLWVFNIIAGMILLFPDATWGKDDLFVAVYGPLMCNVMGWNLLIQNYRNYFETPVSGMGNKQIPLKKMFFAVPVDMKQIKIYSLNKILKPQLIWGTLILICRIGFSVGIYRSVSIWDFVVVCGITLCPLICYWF